MATATRPRVLLEGSFVELGATPGLTGSTTTALFLGLGIDVKNDLLLEYFGESNPFAFANTEIALDSFTITDPLTGAFLAIPNQANINNISAVPAPATLRFIGLGLLAFPLFGRRFA